MPCVPCANELSWTCYPILAPLAPPLGRASKLEAGIDFILNAAHLVHVQSSPLNHDQFPFLREKWNSFSRKRSELLFFSHFARAIIISVAFRGFIYKQFPRESFDDRVPLLEKEQRRSLLEGCHSVTNDGEFRLLYDGSLRGDHTLLPYGRVEGKRERKGTGPRLCPNCLSSRSRQTRRQMGLESWLIIKCTELND